MASISDSRLRRMERASSVSVSLRGTSEWKGLVCGMPASICAARRERQPQSPGTCMLAPMSASPESPSPLEQLQQALQAGDLAAARTALEALRRAGASGAANTQVAAEVLHELRQPLLGIKAYAQMMEEE